MVKPHSPPPGDRGHASATVADQPSRADTGSSIDLRIEAENRRLIDETAVLHMTRTEFVVESAQRRAVDGRLDQRLLSLDAPRFDAFMHALDNPPAPGPKLRSLLRRVPAWQA
ncbi:DUF1778 domain-containing protein [Methylobacterium sp. EM32]|uniref:type II toxin-antitoxin system TacA family antitoxin n=1 Tax=Methylobacterium sp. EM32 TaxID=3163481 RepID=UPI0033AA5945